jgi:hypothetical protein
MRQPLWPSSSRHDSFLIGCLQLKVCAYSTFVPPLKPPKLKSVTLFVEWGYENHELKVSARRWKKIQAGENLGIQGEDYVYEGEKFECYWEFNGNDGPGSLIISYSDSGYSDSGDGYVGTWDDALHEEHFG